jgi:hypothetical protein
LPKRPGYIGPEELTIGEICEDTLALVWRQRGHIAPTLIILALGWIAVFECTFTASALQGTPFPATSTALQPDLTALGVQTQNGLVPIVWMICSTLCASVISRRLYAAYHDETLPSVRLFDCIRTLILTGVRFVGALFCYLLAVVLGLAIFVLLGGLLISIAKQHTDAPIVLFTGLCLFPLLILCLLYAGLANIGALTLTCGAFVGKQPVRTLLSQTFRNLFSRASFRKNMGLSLTVLLAMLLFSIVDSLLLNICSGVVHGFYSVLMLYVLNCFTTTPLSLALGVILYSELEKRYELPADA